MMGVMKPRTAQRARQGRATYAFALFLAVLLVWVTAQPRAAGLGLHPVVSGLAAIRGGEQQALVAPSGKTPRAPDLRHADDGDDELSPSALAPRVRIAVTAARIAAPVAPFLKQDGHRPQPRAPPLG